MWYKAGRFMDSMRAIGDILKKISVICVIKLHAAVLFMCSVLWVYLMHGYDCLYIVGISCICCMCIFTVISV